jgi:TolB-like protein
MTADDPASTSLTVDWTLSGEGVELVQTCCIEVLSKGKSVRLHLRDVSVIDERCRAILRHLAADGVDMTANGIYNSHIVDEIQSEGVRKGHGVSKCNRGHSSGSSSKGFVKNELSTGMRPWNVVFAGPVSRNARYRGQSAGYFPSARSSELIGSGAKYFACSIDESTECLRKASMNEGAKRSETPLGGEASITAGVTSEGIREQLDRILQSPRFADAEKRKLLLRFLVEAFVEGRSKGLREYEVGRAVFGRPASYDPRLDPIVRVQLSNLRSKLREYYAGDGKDDPVRIEFLKGYVPRFERRPVLPNVKNNQPGVRAIRSARAQRAEERRAAKTVAVLPFVDLSPGGDQQYFCDGVTDEIINALSQVRQANVVARTSAFQFKGKSMDVRQIGTQLNSHAVLEGSIRKKEGDLLRVLARLTSVETGYVLWSDAFDRKMQDVFSVQEEIAKAIINALDVRFGRSLQERLSRSAR